MNNNKTPYRARITYKNVKNARNSAKNQVNLYNRGGLNGTRKLKNSRGFFRKFLGHSPLILSSKYTVFYHKIQQKTVLYASFKNG